MVSQRQTLYVDPKWRSTLWNVSNYRDKSYLSSQLIHITLSVYSLRLSDSSGTVQKWLLNGTWNGLKMCVPLAVGPLEVSAAVYTHTSEPTLGLVDIKSLESHLLTISHLLSPSLSISPFLRKGLCVKKHVWHRYMERRDCEERSEISNSVYFGLLCNKLQKRQF